MSDDSKHFSPDKVFLWLFVFTAAEVAWGMWLAGSNKLILWGGLGFFAFLKGWLIAVYFMHLKFEGWVVKSLILPTPLLVLVIWGYVSPDVSRSHHLDHPIGSMYNNDEGTVLHDMSVNDIEHGEAHEEGEH
ncbi:MAG: cytochrome C oxidase subunit IV family protein [Planctomycetota bacterium]